MSGICLVIQCDGCASRIRSGHTHVQYSQGFIHLCQRCGIKTDQLYPDNNHYSGMAEATARWEVYVKTLIERAEQRRKSDGSL